MKNPDPILNLESTQTLYSLSKLKKACNGDPRFMKKMTQLFIQQMPVAVLDIRDSFGNKDFRKMKDTAHRIKPTLENLCVDSLYHTIRDIEGFSNQETGKLANDILQLEKTMTAIIVELKREFDSIAS
jgi:HPt (histidine-containing phosphotransfer) domain-containing protein